MKLALFVQARLTSKRFPNKILSKINNSTVIEILLKRLKRIKQIDKTVVLIPNNLKNNKLAILIKKLNVEVFRGSENNVLDRYYKAARKYKAKSIIRITADCPLIDIKLLKKIINKYFFGNYNYASNISPPTFPDGLDIEIFKFSSLKKAWKNSKSNYDKEHVTPYIIRNEKRKLNIKNFVNLKKLRITLDYYKDLVLIKKIFNFYKPDIYFGLNDIMKLKKKFPTWFEINKKYNLR